MLLSRSYWLALGKVGILIGLPLLLFTVTVRYRRTRWGLWHLRRLNGWELERLVGALYRSRGFEVEVTPGSGDGGVDVIAHKRWLLWRRHVLLVQVKHYSNGRPVSAYEIQKFIEAVRRRCRGIRGQVQAVFVATSGFTAGARELAERHGIEPVDGQELIRELRRSRLKPQGFKRWSKETISRKMADGRFAETNPFGGSGCLD